MIDILRRKMLNLARGEDGVALVVTLALFMFMYISCAGVFAIGKSVKERIILQNAADAAAYSAAVVQADYLSRIATINRAMAWNYAQLVKSQKNWIATRFLLKVKESACAFNAYDPKYDEARYKDLIKVIGSADGTLSIRHDIRNNPHVTYEKLSGYEEDIWKYCDRLKEQNDAQKILRDAMESHMKNAAEDVLAANLPFRMGEMCRMNVKVGMDVRKMGSDDESMFLGYSDADIDSVLSSVWYGIVGSMDGIRRDVNEEGMLKAEQWWGSTDGKDSYPISLPAIDAFDFVSKELPCYGFSVEPLKVTEDHFPSANGIDSGEFKSSGGAITVAVAKMKENPWYGLVEDGGLYDAFDYAKHNDWIFAVASAQAGFRKGGDDASGDAREYSLKWDDFKDVNLGVTDWDALYLPVRKAFAKHGEDGFAEWMMDESKWKELIPAGERKYVTYPLAEIKFDTLNHDVLPRMHNNGGSDRVMKWDSDGLDDFLDLMYH